MHQESLLYNSDANESDALFGYIMKVITLPETLMAHDNNPNIQGYFLFGLPITLPLALFSAPVFFISRQVKIAGEKILQKIKPDPSQTDSKKVLKYISKQKAVQVQVSEQTWKEAMKQVSQDLFIKKKKRIVVVNEMSQKFAKKQVASEKEFIFVVDQNVKIWEIGQMIKNQIKSETDSIVIMYNNSVIPPHMKIYEISFNQLGIIKLAFASIETFG